MNSKGWLSLRFGKSSRLQVDASQGVSEVNPFLPWKVGQEVLGC